MNNLKKLVLLDDNQKYENAEIILDDILANITQEIGIKIDEAILCLLDENKQHNRFEILSSTKINEIIKCKIIEPQIIDKLSISYIAKKPYFDKYIYINFIQVKNFYIFIYIKAHNLYKYLEEIKEKIEGKFNG